MRKNGNTWVTLLPTLCAIITILICADRLVIRASDDPDLAQAGPPDAENWDLVFHDPLNSGSWSSPNASRTREGGQFDAGSGYWEVTAQNFNSMVYSLSSGTAAIQHGWMEVWISNFDPDYYSENPNNIHARQTHELKDYEKYHVMAASNRQKLDHHGDLAGHTGWSLHSLTCAGKFCKTKRTPRDLKLLAYTIDGGEGQEREIFMYNKVGNLRWTRVWYQLAVEWQTNQGNSNTILKLYRDNATVLIKDLYTDGSRPPCAKPIYEEEIGGVCGPGTCPDAGNNVTCGQTGSGFGIDSMKWFAIGADKTTWCDCHPMNDGRHYSLVSARYKNLRVYRHK